MPLLVKIKGARFNDDRGYYSAISDTR
jgi:hypothetical protein